MTKPCKTFSCQKCDFKVILMPYDKNSPPDKSAYWKTIFFISHPKHNYVVGTQKNRLNETVLLSIQNTCLN